MRRTLAVLTGIGLLVSLVTTASATPQATSSGRGTGASAGATERYGSRLDCADGSPICAETNDSIGYGGAYTGHDEPSLLFYSNTAGSGNESNYRVVIPTDPPILPKQDGTGGTFNFQN